MHAVVIGAGVIGVTTAYYLSQRGCRVTVIDRDEQVADEASFGNAGQLSYSFTDALAKPDFVRNIPAIVAGQDRAYRVRLLPGLVPWGIRFLAQCTNRRAAENTVAVLKTALQSERLMQQLQKKLPFEFSHREAGKLVLLSNQAELCAARSNIELKKAHGCNTEILSPDAAADVEPALRDMRGEFVAAVYSKSDCVADSRSFTVGLKELLERSGQVEFRLGAPVIRLRKDGKRVRIVEMPHDELAADAVVVCTGAWSGQLLRPIGVDPQIYPVRGYSVTLPPGQSAPDVSVTVLNRKIVFSRMNGSVRVAGFADFKGLSTSDDTPRIAELIDVARDYAPLAADFAADDNAEWGGFRPMTPNGQPRVGTSGVDGLYLNTGHGMLGWTLACATGHDVAELVAHSVNE